MTPQTVDAQHAIQCDNHSTSSLVSALFKCLPDRRVSAQEGEIPPWLRIPMVFRPVMCPTKSGISHYGTVEYEKRIVVGICWSGDTYRSIDVGGDLPTILGDKDHEGGLKGLVTELFCEARRLADTLENQSDKGLPWDMKAVETCLAAQGQEGAAVQTGR